MSVFQCAKCDGVYDGDWNEAEEIDGELVCSECYLEWKEEQRIEVEEHYAKLQKHYDKIAYLQSDISATSVWSYKYQMLMSPKRYEEIKQEEMEYIKQQKEEE